MGPAHSAGADRSDHAGARLLALSRLPALDWVQSTGMPVAVSVLRVPDKEGRVTEERPIAEIWREIPIHAMSCYSITTSSARRSGASVWRNCGKGDSGLQPGYQRETAG